MRSGYYSKRYGYNDNYFGPRPKSRSSGASFTAALRIMTRIARESERARRADERHKLQVANGVARLNQSIARENERNTKLQAAAAAQRYVASRQSEVSTQNSAIAAIISEFEGLLHQTLAVNDTISFDDLRKTHPFPEFDPNRYLAPPPPPPSLSVYLSKVKRPLGLLMIFGFVKKRFEKKMQNATNEFESALRQHEVTIEARNKQLALHLAKHESQKSDYLREAAENSQKINEFEGLYRSGDSDSIRDYCAMVLERSEYPEGLEQDFDVQFDRDLRTVKVEYELPNREVIPSIASLSYVKSKDTIVEKQRKKTEIANLYSQLIASIAIRTIHELFEADQCNYLDTIEFSGKTETLNPSTGNIEIKFITRLKASKAKFNQINLAGIDPIECFNGMGGNLSVSSR